MLITIKSNFYQKSDLRTVSMSAIINMVRFGQSKSLIAQIRNEPDKAKRNKLKEDLPQFYMCQFHRNEYGSTIENIANHTGLMCFDLDGLADGEAVKLREKLLHSKLADYVNFAFLSPSGGLKFAIQTDYQGNDNEFHKFAYKKLAETLEKIGLPSVAIDGQTCNVNRAVYMSFDPECFYREDVRKISLSKLKSEHDEIVKAEYEKTLYDRSLAQVGAVNIDKARATMESAFSTIVNSMHNGNRHSQIHSICKCCYERGLTEGDAVQYLDRLKMLGHYTESMSTRAKAADSYKTWAKSGGYVKRDFIVETRETKLKAKSASIASIFERNALTF